MVPRKNYERGIINSPFFVTQSVPDPRIVATVEKIMVFWLSNRNQILVLSVLEV